MALGTPVAGTVSYATFSPSVSWPSGITATDTVLLIIGQKPFAANGGTISSISDNYGTNLWTLRGSLTAAGGYGATLGTDTGNTNLRIYSWNNVQASPTGSVFVNASDNDVAWTFMVRVPTSGGAISYGSATGSQSSTPSSSLSVTLTDGSPTTAFQTGDLALWAMCIPTDVTTPAQFTSQTITSSGATFATATEINEPDSSSGRDIGGFSAYTTVSSGSSSAAPTITATVAGTLTNVRGPVVVVRLRETLGGGNFLQFF